MSGDIKFSFRELDNLANQLANHLRTIGVKEGDAVSICLERSAEMVMAVLAVLKAGCFYIPMDPQFPGERLAYMYKDSGARVIISQDVLRAKFDHFPAADVVLVDSEMELISRSSTYKPDINIDNQSLAYMIYTSGSTGTPKGVKVHHEGVVNFIESMKVKPGIKAVTFCSPSSHYLLICRSTNCLSHCQPELPLLSQVEY